MDDGDVRIYESGAIVEYVIERHKNGGLKPEVSDPLYPEYLQWFHYCEGMVMPPVNTIVVQTLLLPPDRRDETVLGQAQRLLAKALEPVDKSLAGRDYLISAFSAADVMLESRLFYVKSFGMCFGRNGQPQRLCQEKESLKRPAFKTAIEMA